MKRDDYCIKLQVGEINPSTRNFVPWPICAQFKEVMIKDTRVMYALFYQHNSKGNHWPVYEETEERDVLSDIQERASMARNRFLLEPKDGRMAYFLKGGSKDAEAEWIAVTDFEFKELSAIFQFVEDDCGDPYVKIVCRKHLDPDGDGIVLLRSDDVDRCPSTRGKQYLDVEVVLQIKSLRVSADVKGVFQRHHGSLFATTLTADMLACWIADQPKPEVTKCIVRFGALLRMHPDNLRLFF
jgi:hypothetical protein